MSKKRSLNRVAAWLLYGFLVLATSVFLMHGWGVAWAACVLLFWACFHFGSSEGKLVPAVVLAVMMVSWAFGLVFCGPPLVGPTDIDKTGRYQVANEIKQLGLAILNYESGHQHLPPAYKTNADGQPAHSWRILVLPLLECENGREIYQQYRMDQPWDSPHNIKLVERMPEVFRSPNSIHENKTVYLGFEGEGTMFDADTPKIGFANISDGSSNTILCVEANDEVAVEWSKPQDIKFDPGSPKANVGGLLPGGFNVVLADGSAHFVSADIDPQALSDLILRNDGNVVNVMNW